MKALSIYFNFTSKKTNISLSLHVDINSSLLIVITGSLSLSIKQTRPVFRLEAIL